MTKVLQLEEMIAADWAAVAVSLESGGLACLPADTVYGLACLPSSAATRKVYEAKGREFHKPLALVFTDVAGILDFVGDLPPAIARVLPRLMPGPLTAVLPMRGGHGGLDIHCEGSIGVRIIPPPMGDLYRLLPGPLAVTSANLSGGPDPCAAGEIPAPIVDACDFVIDGGRLEYCVPSTVVDLRPLAQGGQPIVLREGVLSTRDITRRLETGN